MKKNTPLFLSFSACFLLFIYSPMEFYFTNQDDFLYDIFHLFRVMLPVGLLIFIVSFLFLLTLKRICEKFYYFILYGYFSVFLILYLQGTFFSYYLPTFDGSSVNWSSLSIHRYESIILILAIFALIFFLAHKFGREKSEQLISTASLLIGLILVLASILSGVSSGGFKNKDDKIITDDGIMLYSTDENFLILLLDAVDADCFSSLLEENPSWEEMLTDFTFFPDTMSAYPYTQLSIPFLLSGSWYEEQQSFVDYTTSAYSNSPLFHLLSNEGYHLSGYNRDFSNIPEIDTIFENVQKASGIADPIKFAILQLELTGYRYFPFDLKRFCTIDSYSMWIDCFLRSENGSQYFERPDYTYSLLSKPAVTTPDRQFKFIYTAGAHIPFLYDENVVETADATYESSIAACMTIVDTWLNQLKAAGVYDNSVILVLADHGYNGDDAWGRQNPLLLIKGRNEHHRFSVSNASVSQADYMEADSLLLSGAAAAELFLTNEDNAPRRFLMHYNDNITVLTEYLQFGHASDESMMKQTGNVFP